MFIHIDNKFGKKSVNTDRVSNIVIEGDKFIFNFDYSVSLPAQNNKMIPDYAYLTVDGDEEYKYVDDAVADLNWISNSYPDYKRAPHSSNDNWHIINPETISFLKFEDDKNRIIFNLKNTISNSRDYSKMCSAFIFFDYEDSVKYDAEVARIKAHLDNY